MRSMRRAISRCSTHARPNPYPDWGKVYQRAASRENTPLGRSTSPSARTAAVRYTRVSFLASGPARRAGLRTSPAHGGTGGIPLRTHLDDPRPASSP
jgi:hypothetical protein